MTQSQIISFRFKPDVQTFGNEYAPAQIEALEIACQFADEEFLKDFPNLKGVRLTQVQKYGYARTVQAWLNWQYKN